MVTYIQELADAVVKACGSAVQTDDNAALTSFKALAAELEKLDAMDFAAAARAQFARARAEAQHIASLPWFANMGYVKKFALDVRELMNHYMPGAVGKGRTFRWLTDPDLRAIVERDHAEFSEILVPARAWKSSVIMAGSILEAVLFDLLTGDPKRSAAAKASARAPTRKNGAQKGEDEWTLNDMIELAADINLVPKERAATFDQVLRDYRNFVHPRKEIRSKHPCGEGEADLAKGGLTALFDHFDRTLP